MNEVVKEALGEQLAILKDLSKKCASVGDLSEVGQLTENMVLVCKALHDMGYIKPTYQLGLELCENLNNDRVEPGESKWKAAWLEHEVKQKMDFLKSLATMELVEELATRDGVEKSSCGAYQPYDLTKKYSHDRGLMPTACILIIRDLKPGRVGSRFQPITEDQGQLDRFDKMCDAKELSRDDLFLILSTLQLRQQGSDDAC